MMTILNLKKSNNSIHGYLPLSVIRNVCTKYNFPVCWSVYAETASKMNTPVIQIPDSNILIQII
jgi:hypothetical protein